jgi:hypothetical protein
MSSFNTWIYTLLALLIVAMSTSFWTRVKQRFSSSPVKTPRVATPEEQEQEREALQKAIADAVTAAVNHASFTKAVAVSLASQLQPSLNAALDISSTETKILDSNEKLSKRIDEIETNLLGSNEKLAERFDRIDIQTTQITQSLSEIRNSLHTSSSTNAEAVARMTQSLSDIQDQIASQDKSFLSAHTTKLDSIAAELVAIKGNTETTTTLEALTSSLASIKADIETGTTSSTNKLSDLKSQIDTVVSALDAQNGTLTDIKQNDASAQILEGLERSNNSHVAEGDILAGIVAANESHGSMLAELLSQDTKDILAAVKASNDSHASHTAALSQIIGNIDTQTSVLTEIKGSDASNDILAGVKQSNESHAAHTATLANIKVASEATVPALAELETHVGSIINTLSAIQSSDVTPEILTAAKASNESHAAHSAALSDIKTAVSAPAPVSEPADLTGLETSVKSIISNLETQSGTLEEIKVAASTPAPIAEKTDLTALETQVGAIIETLSNVQSSETAQNTILQEIKEATSTTAPVIEKTDLSSLETSVQTIIATLGSQAATLSEVKSASSGAEILAAINAQDEVLADLKSATDLLAKIETLKSDLASSQERIFEKIDSVTASISEVKEASAGSEILAAIAARDSVLDDLRDSKSGNELSAGIETLKSDFASSNSSITDKLQSVTALLEAMTVSTTLPSEGIIEKLDQLTALVEAIPSPQSLPSSEILNKLDSVTALVEAIPSQSLKPDESSPGTNEEVLNELHQMKAAVQANMLVISGLCEDVKQETKTVVELVRKDRESVSTEEKALGVGQEDGKLAEANSDAGSGHVNGKAKLENGGVLVDEVEVPVSP